MIKKIFLVLAAFSILPISGCAKNSLEKTESARSFGELAYLHYFQGDLEQAMIFAEKAMEQKNAGEAFGYLKARILLNQKRTDQALKIMEQTYKKVPQAIQRDDLQNYMFLLADAERYSDCLKKTELYFEQFGYFNGLGKFASTLYEKNGDYFNSVLSAFLDFEYLSCFVPQSQIQLEAEFLSNMQKLEQTVAGTEKQMQTEKAVECLKANFNPELPVPQISCNSFIYQYLCHKKQIISENCTSDAINEYMKLENYFSAFPVYYWNLYSALNSEQNENPKNLIPVLEKVLNAGFSSVYSQQAKAELGRLNNLLPQEAQAICTSAQVAFILRQFEATADNSVLQPIFDLLALPDCPYVYSAIEQTKNFRARFPVDAALSQQLAQSSGRLKDRLTFILN